MIIQFIPIQSMNGFKFQAENENYLNENHQNYSQLIKLLSNLISIDSKILQFFPKLDQSPLDAFWKGQCLKNNDKQERKNNLIRVSCAYFHIRSKHKQYIDNQYQKFLQRHSKIPLHIKFCFQLKNLTKIIQTNNDIKDFQLHCLAVKKQMSNWLLSEDKNKSKTFKNLNKYAKPINQRYNNNTEKWSDKEKIQNKQIPQEFVEIQQQELLSLIFYKIQACIIILNEFLGQKQVNRKQFLHFLKVSKNLAADSRISSQFLLQIYFTILRSGTKRQKQQKPAESLMKYLSVEYRILYQKLNSKTKIANNTQNNYTSKGTLNLRRQNLIKTFFNKLQVAEENQDHQGYLQSDQRQKNNSQFKKCVQLATRRTQLSKSLAYSTFQQKFRNNINREKHQTYRSEFSKNKTKGQMTQTNRSVNLMKIKKGFQNGMRNLSKRNLNSSNKNTKSNSNSLLCIQQTSNFYYKMFITDKKDKKINISQLQNETLTVHEISLEKPTPNISEILVTENEMDRKNNKQDIAYSFGGRSSEIITFSGSRYLTFIQSFCSEIIYLGIKVEDKINQNLIKLTSYSQQFFQEKMKINQTSRLSFHEVEKEVHQSEFYFELIQESVEKSIEVGEVQAIMNHFEQQQCHKSTLTLISINRLCRALTFWYFTKAIKINGVIWIKRKIPHISDPLKFSIALQFLKKYEREQCLQKIGSSRNNAAIYQCFRYFFYGRKIITKGIMKVRQSKQTNYNYFCLSLQKISEQNIVINPEESYFQNLQFSLRIFDMKNWSLIKTQAYHLSRYLSKKQITLFLLSTITGNYLNPHIVKSILKDINRRYSLEQYSITFNTHFGYNIKLLNNKYAIQIKNLEQDDKSFHKQQRSCSKFIKNFHPLIQHWIEVYQKGIDIKIIEHTTKILKIGNYKFLNCQQFHLACGLVFGIVQFSQFLRNVYVIQAKKNKCEENNRKEQLVKLITPYYNKIVRVTVNEEFKGKNIIQCLSVRKNLIQSHKKNNLKNYFKTIKKVDKKYLYVSVSWQIQIQSWRIDIYDMITSKCYGTYLSHKQGFIFDKLTKEQSMFNRKVIQSLLVSSMTVDLKRKKLYIQKQEFSLFETYGILYNYAKDSMKQGSIQLIDLQNNKLYALLIYQNSRKQKCQQNVYLPEVVKLNICEVDDSPLAYNINIYADYAKKQHDINIYSDMLLRLYFKFMSWPGLQSTQLQTIDALHLL